MSASQNPKPLRNVILVAVDLSKDAIHVLDAAVDLARKTPGAELHVVHAVDPRDVIRAEANSVQPYEIIMASRSDMLDEHAKRAREMSGVTVIGHLVEDGAERGILQTAASIDADTIVVGTHGRRGLARLTMGSVAEGVVRKASCPVWVVREKHNQTPEPEIEPPCPDCVEMQRTTGGATLWCERHGKHHPRAHLHYANPQGFGAGSSLIQS